MKSVYDLVSVLGFVGLLAVWFRWGKRDVATLLHFLLVAATLAVANQVGNAGWVQLALILIVAACGYTFVIVKT